MRIRLFFSALALTLLLLLPMVGLVEYFAMQRQMQERVRRANAAGTAVQVDPASRYMCSLLLAVQKEEPEFILLRMDAPAATLTLCGLPGSMQLAAPSGTTTLAAAYLAAGPARAAQLLGDTLGTAPQHYLAATPSCYASFWEQGTTVRLDMAALQEDTDPHQNFVAEIEAATAETALRDLGAEQTDAGAARLLAAYTAALFRQNPQQLAALPGQARQASARILTDLQAQDWNTLESVFNYFSTVPALVVETALPSFTSRPEGELALTENGQQTVQEVLRMGAGE